MNINIIGAGAMGSLFGSLLARSGQNVLLLDIWKEHVDAINQNGLMVEFQGETTPVDVKASESATDTPEADLVIIFVKSTQTVEAAIQARQCLQKDGVVLTLQNGMGNADQIASVVGAEKVIGGTTSHGATVLGPGRIRHAGVGPTLIGMWAGSDDQRLHTIKTLFDKAGIDTQVEADIHKVVWKKLIINVGINAVTALTGIKNGRIVDAPPTGPLVRDAVREACDVALAYNVNLPDDMPDQVFHVAQATSANRSSMGQDVDHQRRTEIDAINGAVVRMADEKGINAPVNRTLTALIQTLQNHYE